ncbi:MAG: Histidine kinaselike ATPase domain [Solirubrobacteraceae bacterium]|jgi:hypothetical protein|nr:Histidine kinaselike ATPase domain [Solirubrobacteraceae bacterium]
MRSTADTHTAERDVELPATAAAAGMARRELAATPGLAGELGYRVLLLASELIAVFVSDEPQPGGVLRLSIAVSPARVRITVAGDAPHDSADALMHSRETPSLGGYGLQIVDRMATAWGTAGAAGEQIWFELAR